MPSVLLDRGLYLCLRREKMTIEEKALKFHGDGFNCAQSVLAAFHDYTGLDDKIALAICGGLGGGVRCGEICGALTGAVMVLGMRTPFCVGNDAEAKAKIAVMTKAFTKQFKEEFGCIRCLDLKMNRQPCDKMIAYCAKAAEEAIKNSKL